MSDEPEVYPLCRCGREMRKLNVARWRAHCVGCGLPSEECRCQPID